MVSLVLPVSLNLDSRSTRFLRLIGRLQPGVGRSQARAALETLAMRLRHDYPDHDANISFEVVEARENRYLTMRSGRAVSGLMSLLMAVVGVVLLIACSNVTNLLLARAVAREREIALRQTLGGSRWRIVRQLVTESVLLTLMAGTAGVLFAIGILELLNLLPIPPTPIPLSIEPAGINWGVLRFTLLISVLTGLVIGLVPAFRVRGLDLHGSLKNHVPGRSTPRRSRLQTVLVTGQISLSLVLLISAALSLKHLGNMAREDPGFDVGNTLLVDLNLTYGQYDETQGREFFQHVLEDVEKVPGVRSASLAYNPPLVSYDSFGIEVDGYEPAEGETLSCRGNVVGPGFFETLGIPIERGRGIEQQDQAESQPVIVVNETFARRFWPGEDAVGKRVKTRDQWREVIGVARDAKYLSLAEEPRPYLYLALNQHTLLWTTIIVRSHGTPQALAEPVAQAIRALDPDLPVVTRTMAEQVQLSQYNDVLGTVVSAAFALLGLVLASLGIYSVMAYSVRQRTYELGIRAALGGRQQDILRLVLRRGMVITLVGLGLGLAGALAVSRLLAAVLHDVKPLEPLIFVAVTLALGMVALLACYVPAFSASRVNPIVALRND
jgi:predicted permease